MSTDTVPSPADMAAFSGARTQSAPLRVPEQPLQIPVDLQEHLAAVDAYRRAVEEIAKVDQLLDQAQAKRAKLLARLAEALEVMRETDPSRRGKKVTRKAAGQSRSATVESITAALPGTARSIADQLGRDARGVAAVLTTLVRQGKATRSADGTYHKAEA